MLPTSKIQGRKAYDDLTKFQELVWENIPTIQPKPQIRLTMSAPNTFFPFAVDFFEKTDYKICFFGQLTVSSASSCQISSLRILPISKSIYNIKSERIGMEQRRFTR